MLYYTLVMVYVYVQLEYKLLYSKIQCMFVLLLYTAHTRSYSAENGRLAKYPPHRVAARTLSLDQALLFQRLEMLLLSVDVHRQTHGKEYVDQLYV